MCIQNKKQRIAGGGLANMPRPKSSPINAASRVSASASHSDAESDEERAPRAEDPRAVTDIQCFYCETIFWASERFVLCEKCEGFVSCLFCWTDTEREGKKWSVEELELQQRKLLQRDERRKYKLWPNLQDHGFRMEHADWTDPDKGHFHVYTWLQLKRLRDQGLGDPTRKKSEHRPAASVVSQESSSSLIRPSRTVNGSFELRKQKGAAQTTLVHYQRGPKDLTQEATQQSHALLQLFNAHLVRPPLQIIEVRASRHIPQPYHQPCELGVFAIDRIFEGEVIDFYAAHLRDRDNTATLSSKSMSYSRVVSNATLVLDGWPTAALFSRPTARSAADMQHIMDLPASRFLPATKDERELLATLPLGCMINSPEGTRYEANVRCGIFKAKPGHGVIEADYPVMVASKNINVGEELLCPYNITEARGWIEAAKQRALLPSTSP